MEVHHHPDVKKKKIKEYLLEGFMIFVAVTMGFFAESLRESMGNKEKETEYINSLIHNLEQDKTNINYTIHENENKISGLDTLLSLALKDMSAPENRESLYNYSRWYVSFYSGFNSNDATMMQLKNAGGLQYIKHNHVADSISKYDQEMRAIYAAEAPYAKAINDAMDAMSELIVFAYKNDSTPIKNTAFSNQKYPLLTNDPQKLALFFNKISLERGWTQNYVNNLKGRDPYISSLIELLKKDYKISEK